jgi:NAD(P)-dependent dehydrogenase (short-subunit alcohol dehydrogenase family)
MTSHQPVAIVTGAGRGLGRSHVEALVEAGYAVVVNDLGSARDGRGIERSVADDTAAALRAAGGRAVPSTHDVADFEQAAALVQLALDTFGRLDALVNNAGILRDRMLVNTTPQEWDDVVRVHLRGTFAVLQAGARHWRALTKAGTPVAASIVNTTSPSGLYGKPGQANYGAAKAGIASLTMIAAEELKAYGVRVNAIAPVAFTRMTEDLVTDPAAAIELAPERVSPLVAWLAGPDSAEVTGRVFEISGRRLAVVDPWRREVEEVPLMPLTVEAVGKIATRLLGEARPLPPMGGNL